MPNLGRPVPIPSPLQLWMASYTARFKQEQETTAAPLEACTIALADLWKSEASNSDE